MGEDLFIIIYYVLLFCIFNPHFVFYIYVIVTSCKPGQIQSSCEQDLSRSVTTSSVVITVTSAWTSKQLLQLVASHSISLRWVWGLPELTAHFMAVPAFTYFSPLVYEGRDHHLDSLTILHLLHDRHQLSIRLCQEPEQAV